MEDNKTLEGLCINYGYYWLKLDLRFYSLDLDLKPYQTFYDSWRNVRLTVISAVLFYYSVHSTFTSNVRGTEY